MGVAGALEALATAASSEAASMYNILMGVGVLYVTVQGCAAEIGILFTFHVGDYMIRCQF